MQYNPKDASQVWPEGDYDAELLKVVQGQSKNSGADMETWTFKVYNNDGRSQLINDYVTVPACTFKIKQLAKAFGCDAQFASGAFQAEEHVSAGLRVKLTIEEGTGGYDDKNKIGKCLPATAAAPSTAPTNGKDAAGIPAQRKGSPFEGKPSTFKEAEIPF